MKNVSVLQRATVTVSHNLLRLKDIDSFSYVTHGVTYAGRDASVIKTKLVGL